MAEAQIVQQGENLISQGNNIMNVSVSSFFTNNQKVKMKKLGKSKPGGYKSLVTRHLGSKAAEKIDKSDGSKLVAKGKKTGNTDLIRKGNFIKNVIGRK